MDNDKMDFGALLHIAQKNNTNKQSVSCYQTKFQPLKKQAKQSKPLSENIKKFLARKEEEERQKALEEERRKQNLLALRDRKANSRINKHLKVCKAANKSVLADAINNENTAITLAGPSQPDEDDYGYVSQEASAFYNRLMEKYNNAPPEKSIFSETEKRTITDIASTKDRVKNALKQGVNGIPADKRKRKANSSKAVKEDEIDEKEEKSIIDKIKDEDKDEQPKAKKKPLPTPMNFVELLKLAEKKQHEPVLINIKPKVEEERPMTKRQMEEYKREKEWRERREQRDKCDLELNKKTIITNTCNKSNKPQLNKMSKTSEKFSAPDSVSNKSAPKVTSIISKKITNKYDNKSAINKINSSENISKNELLEEWKKLQAEKKQLEEMRSAIEEKEKKLAQSKNKQEDIKLQTKSFNKTIAKSKNMDKQISPKDIKLTRPITSANLKSHSVSSNDNKVKTFSPPDIRSKPKQVIKKGIASNKRRIYDDDDEDEYDSDLDDFIDDGPVEDTEDYSEQISKIFGYDKSKYKNLNDEDDTTMESNYAQQLKEEYVSTKIGIMEDLEDIRMEALEKQRKARLKAKK